MTASPQVVALGSVTAWVSGGTPDRAVAGYWNGSIPWISAASLKSIRIRDSDQHVTEAGLRAGSRLAPEGATLVLVRGMALHREVRAGIATRPMSFNQDVKALIPGPSILPEFLTYSLHARAPRILDLVSSAGSGTGVLDTGQLKRLQLLLPELPEQRAIISAVDDAESETATLECLIAKREAIKRGMMQQLLTGKTRLPGFTTAWTRSTVGAVADVKTGPFGSTLHERDYVSRGTPIITVEHLGSRRVLGAGAPMVSDVDRRRLRAYSLAEGDIVFSRVGSIDRNARVSSREAGWLFSGRLLRVRLDRSVVDSRFMSAQFHAPAFTGAVRAVAVGQTMPSLNTSILKSISIDLPRLDEQKAIGRIAADLDGELDRLDARLTKARSIKRGMMQQLLTGRTRLPVAGAVV
ncbi:MAG: restriction endonuclease subunit S [Solirubrobacteraceae bacterium]